MPTAPTRVSYTEVVWNTTGTSKATASISWQTGDVIVVMAASESAAASTEIPAVPTATGLTFASQVVTTAPNSFCSARISACVAGSNGSGAVTTMLGTNAIHWGFGVWVYRGSAGLGNSASQTTATKTKALTPTGADSAVVWGAFDFAAGTAGAGTPTPTTTPQSAADAGRYTRLVCDLTDQVSAGATSYGQSGGGATGPFTIVAFEIKGAAGASGITADASITEANDTLSADATLAIAAALAVTEADDTLSAAATLAIVADLAVTEANDTLTADASLAILADFALTEAADTLSADATLAIAAALGATEADDTLSAAATLAIVADLAVTEDADTLASAAALGILADLSIIEADDTLSATADGGTGGGPITADASITEDADTLGADAQLAILADFASTDAADTLAAAATLGILADLGVTEGDDTLSAAATLAIVASLGITEADDTLSADFSYSGGPTITADLAVTEDNDTLSAFVDTGAMQPARGGSSGPFRRGPGSVAHGPTPERVRRYADLSITEDDDVLVATATMSEAPLAQQRRRTLQILLMH